MIIPCHSRYSLDPWSRFYLRDLSLHQPPRPLLSYLHDVCNWWTCRVRHSLQCELFLGCRVHGLRRPSRQGFFGVRLGILPAPTRAWTGFFLHVSGRPSNPLVPTRQPTYQPATLFL